MSSRRSARLQNQDLVVEDPIPVEVITSTRRAKSQAKGSAGAKKKSTTSALAINPSRPNSGEDALSSLSPELLYMVLDNIKDPSTIGKLGRTNKGYYALMMPLLHKRIAVAAPYHAHIAKLIRNLEPYLTIAQKRQLKKEGTYKGQQERYSSKLDAKEIPACASYARQMVVGYSDPGRKHQYIVHRYVEETLKNTSNLEIAEMSFLTESMGQSIASLKSLQALRLHSGRASVENGAMEPLAAIRNLKHLSVEIGSHNHPNVIRSILWNSRSTLRSLDITSSRDLSIFFKEWDKTVSANVDPAPPKPTLTALKSLALCHVSFDAASVKSLQGALDFMSLRNMTLGRMPTGTDLFFQYLTSLAISAKQKGTSIGLRNLSLEMREDSYAQTPEGVSLESKCGFLAAFDTLTDLELIDYGQYRDTVATNPGLPNTLFQAILKHKNLKSLKMTYHGIISGYKVPYLSATTVGVIVDNLPELQELVFAPEEREIDEIGKALSRGKNLTSIKCFPHDSWAVYPRPDEPGLNILKGIIGGFLSHQGDNDGGENFIWEDLFKLKRISVIRPTWDIASKFGKPEKGVKKAVKMTGGSDERREVWYRDISTSLSSRGADMYGPSCAWLDKVETDLV